MGVYKKIRNGKKYIMFTLEIGNVPEKETSENKQIHYEAKTGLVKYKEQKEE